MAGEKIYLSPSSQEGNPYATGNTNEEVQCEKIAQACATCLRSAGFEVKVGPSLNGPDMTDRMEESKAWKSDLHVPIHTNAGNGSGPLVITKSTTENDQNFIVSNCIYQALKALTGKEGFGVKSNDGYKFSEISSMACLVSYVECEFHDSVEGSDFILNNIKELGEAIAKGICDYYSVATNFSVALYAQPDPGVAVYTATPEAYPDPAQNITLSTDVTLRNGNFSYSFELPKKEDFNYYHTKKNGRCGYTTFLVINNTEIKQLETKDITNVLQEDSTTRVSGRFVLKDILSNADMNKLKAADSIQFGVKTYVKKPDNSTLYSYDIPHASNSICLRVNNYNIIINPYNKD